MKRFRGIADAGVLLCILFFLVFVGALLCSGCVWTDQGSRTIVGTHTALPTVSTTDGEVDIKVYESIEGAMVSTRKDSKVCISYSNAYTNSVFGVWDKTGLMNLDVIIEPIAVTNCVDESTHTVDVDVNVME